MPRPLSLLVWRDFKEGLNDGVPMEAGQKQASRLQNLYIEQSWLERRKGTSPLGTGNLSPNQDLDGLGWFKVTSTEYLLAAHNGGLTDWLAATPGTTVTNSTGKTTSGTDANMAWVDGKVYIGDGLKQNIRFNGTRVDQVLTDTPSSALTAAVGAAGGPTGTYTYYVTFISADGNHSPTSPLSNSVTVVNQKINLSSIPTCGAGQDCSGRGIWRNKNGSTVYYNVTTIADNTTTVFTDDKVDSALGDRLNDFLGENLQNRRFPPCRYLIAHQNRLIGAGCNTVEGDKQTVYISNYQQPWYCPILPDFDDPNQGTRIPLQGPAAGEITGIHSHGDRVAVFTGGAAYLLTTSDQLLDYALHRFSDHGCVAHRTIRSVRDMLIWLAPDGVYMAREGQPVTRISDDVAEEHLPLTDPAMMAKAHAFVWKQRYFLCWPTGCVWFDLRYQAWGENTAWNWRVSAVTTFTTGLVERIYGAQAGAARVWQMETGATDNGAAIATVWESADWDCGLPYRDKRIHLAGLKWKLGVGTATVALFRETGTTAIQTATKDLSVADVTGATIAKLDQRIAEQGRGEYFRLRVTHSDALATEYLLLQADVLWSMGT
jgi:hypothetical protein